MIANELTTRVTIGGALGVAGAAILAAGLGGAAEALGVLAGGGLALLDFRWLARSVRSGTAVVFEGRRRAAWMLAMGARFVVVFAAVALVLASGRVAPLGVMAGLTTLPLVLIAQGLWAARDPA